MATNADGVLNAKDDSMKAEAVHAFVRKQPFEPFEVRLSSGDVHPVRHPEFAMLLKNTLVIGYPDSRLASEQAA